MNKFVLLFGCVLLYHRDTVSSQNATNVRIVGGLTASEGQFPYMVSLRFPNNEHACGGSIINEYWILTAAHCIYMTTQQLSVVVGANHLRFGGFAYPAVKYLYHKDFNSKSILNDIALIKVGIPIQFNTKVRPISLANYNISPGYSAVISGWGKLGVQFPVSETLQYQIFQTMDISTCSIFLFPNYIKNTQICAYSTYGQGTCQGDSGGPLVINGLQHGITSWGIECAVGKPDVYTKVYSYLKWIRDTIRGN